MNLCISKQISLAVYKSEMNGFNGDKINIVVTTYQTFRQIKNSNGEWRKSPPLIDRFTSL